MKWIKTKRDGDSSDGNQQHSTESRPKNLRTKEHILYKPNFDNSFTNKQDGMISSCMFAPNNGSSSSSATTISPPSFDGSIPITEPNLLAWLFQGTQHDRSLSSVDSSENIYPPANKIDTNTAHSSKREHHPQKNVRRKDWYGKQLEEEEEITINRYHMLTSLRQRRGKLSQSEFNSSSTENDKRQQSEQNDPIDREQSIETNLELNEPEQFLHQGQVRQQHPTTQNNDEEDDEINDDDNREEDLALPPLQGFFPFIGFAAGHDFLQEERRDRELEEQEVDAANIIAIGVEQYRKQNISEDDFEVIPMLLPEDDLNSFTLRRICFGIVFVVGAFIFLMLQTIPFLSKEDAPYPIFDEVLYELLDVKTLETHSLDGCNGFEREDLMQYPDSNSNNFIYGKRRTQRINCADGVLHVPSKNALQLYSNTTHNDHSFSRAKRKVYSDYQNGVNITWFHPCVLKKSSESSCVLRREMKLVPSNHSDYFNTCGVDDNKACVHGEKYEDDSTRLSCFRGVHDGMISNEEVDNALRLAGKLVSQGGQDHAKIYTNTSTLYEHIPSILEKVQSLLLSRYATPQIEPIAYRFSASVPMDGSTSKRQKNAEANNDLLGMTVNKSVFMSWGRKVAQINEWPVISFPPLIGSNLYRDPCILGSDLDANDRYAFHTSVFLSEGSGHDYSGGVMLYVDDHESNLNPRKKIHRGVTIDGSKGRIVVSTGGADNLRCRLPTRSGIRCVLQIWWDCI